MIPEEWRERMQEVCNKIWKRENLKDLDRKNQMDQFLILAMTIRDSFTRNIMDGDILEKLQVYYPQTTQDHNMRTHMDNLRYNDIYKENNTHYSSTYFWTLKQKFQFALEWIKQDDQTWHQRQQTQSSKVSASSSSAVSHEEPLERTLDLFNKSNGKKRLVDSKSDLPLDLSAKKPFLNPPIPGPYLYDYPQ